MTKNSGQTAVNHGAELENLVKMVLERLGYEYVESNKFILATNGLEQKLYTKQHIIGDSIYSTPEHEHKIKVDFVIYNPRSQEKYIVIECKSQTSAGSVDEKYPYLNENIKHNSYKTIIILDAPAAKPGAKKWLKDQEGKNNNLLRVFGDFSEFRAWATKNL